MKKPLISLLVLFVLFGEISLNSTAATPVEENIAIYFYSPTCTSCKEISDHFESINDTEILKYDVTLKENKNLFNTYCSNYDVPADYRFVPILFFGDRFFSDRGIIDDFYNYAKQYTGEKTPILISEESSYDKESFEQLSIPSIFVAGLVNGINPCSISLFLFFISMLLSSDKKIRKSVYSFLFGKFFSFLLLGTFLFQVLSKINFSSISLVVKIIIISVTVILILFNIHDFIAIKQNRIENVRLQLPKKLIKFNHKLIKAMTNKKAGLAIAFLSLFLGMLVASGEFLCTGQIYLSTIVSILHYENSFSGLALLYLLIYDIAFILPLIVCSEIIIRGKTVLSLSSVLVNRLDIIKLINIVILSAFILFYILF